MTEPTNTRHWTLRHLVDCGYCGRLMYPAQRPGGPRRYRCGPPCGRSDVDAGALELMALHAAVPPIPGLPEVVRRTDLAPAFTERYRRVLVYGGLTDVRFVNVADRPPVRTQVTVTLTPEAYAWLDTDRTGPPILVLEAGDTELCLVLDSDTITSSDARTTRRLADLVRTFAERVADRAGWK